MKLKRLILPKKSSAGFFPKNSCDSILMLYATNLKNIIEQNQNLPLGLKPSN